MEGIIDLHHDIMFFIVLISIFTFWMIFKTVYLFRLDKGSIRIPSNMTHHTQIEIIWTVIPSLILLSIALPSFALLYKMDEIVTPDMTFKAIGNQWYWTYEYVEVDPFDNSIECTIIRDSYMASEELLVKRYTVEWADSLRLLDATESALIPIKLQIRILITSTDVLHSWAVPSLGIKLDACPGRLNEVSLFIKREGFYYGQCSEICGINHAFMPIVIQATKYYY